MARSVASYQRNDGNNCLMGRANLMWTRNDDQRCLAAASVFGMRGRDTPVDLYWGSKILVGEQGVGHVMLEGSVEGGIGGS